VSGSVTPELRNWSGTYRFTAPTVIAARTIDEVRRAVTTAGRVRALGTRHSFNDLADNGDTLVTVTGIAPEPVLDEAARTVTVGAGATYGAIAGWLQQRGWALHNLGSLPHISVAGATATGTHGSGSRNQILSAATGLRSGWGRSASSSASPSTCSPATWSGRTSTPGCGGTGCWRSSIRSCPPPTA